MRDVTYPPCSERGSSGGAGGSSPERQRDRAGWAGDPFGSFALELFEVVPMGLLTEINGRLRVPVATGGQAVVVLASVSACRRQALSIFSAGVAGR
jgi:hypothetical protein